jgi:hypothetical protein
VCFPWIPADPSFHLIKMHDTPCIRVAFTRTILSSSLLLVYIYTLVQIMLFYNNDLLAC